MDNDMKEKLYSMLNSIEANPSNYNTIAEIKQAIDDGNMKEALEKIKSLNYRYQESNITQNEKQNIRKSKLNNENLERNAQSYIPVPDNDEIVDNTPVYPKQLMNLELEQAYLGFLLNNLRAISRYYIPYDLCLFSSKQLLDIYKSIIFTDAEMYAPESAKRDFSIYKDFNLELKLKIKDIASMKNYNIEKLYVSLEKLFILRKNYLKMPIKEMQDKLLEIVNYNLYNEMSTEEVESAINQIIVTNKFKQSVLNEDVTQFLLTGDNNLTTGLSLPFPILTKVFKGIRKGETMAFAMPSNAGKSRFTMNLASYIAFNHKKKVLVISNEMSEEKMKLCLITTILNNPDIQKMHGQKLHKSEGELLEFKFKADNPNEVTVDENGFVLRKENESRIDFIKRLSKVSSEFNEVTAATDWLSKEIENSIYFINITDHTNDELKKVIMNYYYKEKTEYVFYDTLKTDTANIGNDLEIKKTTTILSNLAQNFGMFIGATIQLAETKTLPINLDVNDLSVSRTVKEVLDTLCLVKQIYLPSYEDYQYSLNEVDTKFFDLEKFDDPNVRYYACVVDKNRAGSKPKLLFRLNLAYNSWNELGYLRLNPESGLEEKIS